MLSPDRGTHSNASHASSFLHTGEAFGDLHGKTAARFEEIAVEASFERGENLFIEGQQQAHVYVMNSGRVKLSVSSREGKSVILRVAGVGDVLGLSAALAGTPHEMTAVVLERCTVRAIRLKDFLAFLKSYPEAAMEAARCVLQKYKVIFNDVCRLALPSTVAGRLANLLLEWRNQRPNSRFTIVLTHEEIASMTGTSRETVTRVLQQFQRDKYISIKGSSVTVLQPEALEELAI